MQWTIVPSSRRWRWCPAASTIAFAASSMVFCCFFSAKQSGIKERRPWCPGALRRVLEAALPSSYLIFWCRARPEPPAAQSFVYVRKRARVSGEWSCRRRR